MKYREKVEKIDTFFSDDDLTHKSLLISMPHSRFMEFHTFYIRSVLAKKHGRICMVIGKTTGFMFCTIDGQDHLLKALHHKHMAEQVRKSNVYYVVPTLFSCMKNILHEDLLCVSGESISL